MNDPTIVGYGLIVFGLTVLFLIILLGFLRRMR